MKEFTEAMRYEYDLNENSMVVDLGTHMGTFTRGITDKYNCTVIGFEPIREFYDKAIQNQTPKVTIHNCALGAEDCQRVFGVAGDSSGQFVTNQPNAQGVLVIDVCVLHSMCPNGIDLIKINIEGGEYEVLNRLIECDMVKNIRDIQIQYHMVVGDYQSKRANISLELAKTHHLTYCIPYIWENWRRNE